MKEILTMATAMLFLALAGTAGPQSAHAAWAETPPPLPPALLHLVD